MDNRRKIHRLIRHYLVLLRLGDWKCTKLVISPQLIVEGEQVDGWCSVPHSDRKRFHLGLRQGLELPKLTKVIVHEIAHIPTTLLEDATCRKDQAVVNKWAEFISNLIERLVQP